MKFRKTSTCKKISNLVIVLKTLVFDLDETLVRSEFRFKEGFDKKISLPCKLSWTGRTPVYLFFRPYLEQMLKVLKKHFEIIVFTAA